MNFQEIYEKYLKTFVGGNNQENMGLTDEQQMIFSLFFYGIVLLVLLIFAIVRNGKFNKHISQLERELKEKDNYINRSVNVIVKEKIIYKDVTLNKIKLKGKLKDANHKSNLLIRLISNYNEKYNQKIEKTKPKTKYFKLKGNKRKQNSICKNDVIKYIKLKGKHKEINHKSNLLIRLILNYSNKHKQELKIERDKYIRDKSIDNIKYLRLKGKFKEDIYQKGLVSRLVDKYDELTSGISDIEIQIRKDEVRKNKMKYLEYSGKKKCMQLNLYQSIGDLYKVRKSLMNQGEQKVFYFLNKILSNYIYREEFFVFPQVRVIDFVDLTNISVEFKVENKMFYNMILSSITSKSVDFLICRKVTKEYRVEFIPCLVLELDGEIHRENDLNIIKNDVFKDMLFDSIGLKLKRIPYQNLSDLNFELMKNIIDENLRI